MNLLSLDLNQKRIIYAVLVVLILAAAGLACNVPVEAMRSVEAEIDQRATVGGHRVRARGRNFGLT